MPDDPPYLTGIGAVLQRLPTGVAVAVAVLAMLAWAGPGFRESLSGMFSHGFDVWLARLYLGAVVLTFLLLVWLLVAPNIADSRQRLSRRQLRDLRAALGQLGHFSAQGSTLVQAVYQEADAGQRQERGARALELLAEWSCKLFASTEGANRSLLLVETQGLLVPHQYCHFGFSEEELELVKLPATNVSIAGYVYATGWPYLAAPAGEDAHYFAIPGVEPPGAVLCVPVLDVVGNIRAILSVDSRRQDGFVPDNAPQLQVIASRVSDVLAAL